MFLAMEFLRKCPEWGWLNTEAVEAPKVEIGGAIRQPARCDRVVIVDEEQEDVAVRGIKRGRVTADLDIGVVDPGRPVEHARHLPARVTRAIARNALHRLDQLVVMDTAIIRARHRAQLGAAVFRLEGLHLLGTVVGQAILQVDPRQRRGQLPQVGGRRTDDAGKLAEGPVRGRNRFMRLRQNQVKPLGAVARGLDADVRRLHHAAAAALGPALHIGPEIVEREIPLIIGPVEPFGRHPPVPLTPAHIHLPATRPCRRDRIQNFYNAHRLSPVTGAGSHSPSPQPVTAKPALL